MSSTKSIKQRIKSVKNTSQITKAMEVVSAIKMRKAQEFAIGARPYAVASLELLKNLLSRTAVLPEFLTARPVKTSALLVITSDKGLAGAFNANVLKKAEIWIREKKLQDASFAVVTVGKTAKDYFERRQMPIQQSFSGFGDYFSIEETLPIAKTIIDGFLFNVWDEVEAVYTHFRTTLMQEAAIKRILPVTKEGIEEMVAGILPERGKYANSNPRPVNTKYSYEYKFEPSPVEILNELVPQLLRMHMHHIVLESNASEHSARMVAMKSASDNARELITDLTLEFNKVRQAGITRELTEITAGAEAMER